MKQGWPSSRTNEYTRLGRTDANRREAYRALFRALLDEVHTDAIRDATNGNFVPGGKRFQAQIAKAVGRPVTRGIAGRPVEQSTAKDKRQGELL